MAVARHMKQLYFSISHDNHCLPPSSRLSSSVFATSSCPTSEIQWAMSRELRSKDAESSHTRSCGERIIEHCHGNLTCCVLSAISIPHDSKWQCHGAIYVPILLDLGAYSRTSYCTRETAHTLRMLQNSHHYDIILNIAVQYTTSPPTKVL